jgi:diguanylate cyclase (GGDEF)-like protein
LKKGIIWTIFAAFVGVVLYLFSKYNYLFFHMTIEFFTVLVGVLIFTVSAISKKFNQNSFLNTLGPGILGVSLITYLHLVTYKGISIISGYDSNLPTQLWIVLNYFLSLSILYAIWNENKKAKYRSLLISNLLIGTIATALCFARFFPDCFIEGSGLTLFKRISEFIIIVIYLTGIFLLYKKKQSFSAMIFKTIAISLVLFSVAEFMFTLYSDVYGIQNFLGHFIRLVAFFLIFTSVAIEGIQKPYKTIFAKLNKLSITDGLTNLFNQRFFLEGLEICKDLSLRDSKCFYLMLFDIDHFKNINDTFGHLIGDEVLIETAKCLKKNIRNTDYAFRNGGDEFAIILYDVAYDAVIFIINRIRETFAVSKLTNENIFITLSGGIAKYSGGSIQELIKKTDQLLYRAKKDGRNRMYFDEEEEKYILEA